MKTDDFAYELPEELVAQQPAPTREAGRLLVHDTPADRTTHARAADLPDFLREGDLLVFNDTRVRPLRMFARRASGGLVELLLLERLPDDSGVWRALVNPARKLKPGERVALEPDGCGIVMLERPTGEGGEPDPAWRVRWDLRSGETEEQCIERLGRMPLPPYIRRARGGDDPLDALDRERYQTVWAREPGAIAAPTAGLHFGPELLARLEDAGIERTFVTLHVGEGTFRPVKVDRLEEHRMHAERYRLGEAAADAIRACRSRGGRVVAVGTTSVRVLESCADEEGRLRPGEGETRLFLHPGSPFRVVDRLFTNFHLPRSTLLMLVAAFAGRERVLRLYREAVERSYRFFSYGDAMLISRSGGE